MNSSLTTDSHNDIAANKIENVLSLSNRELFWGAKYIESSPCLEHIPFLFWMISDLRPLTTVTTDMTKGVAHFAICQAAEKTALEVVCYGFGNWEEWESDQQVPEALKNYSIEQYEDISKIYRETIEGSAERFDENSVDLLFVGQPPSENVLDILEQKWFSRMSNRGVVMLSGLEEGLSKEPSRRRISALCKIYPHFEFQHGGGLLLLLIGTEPTERLRLLTSATSRTPGCRSILQMFRRLGAYYSKELRARREAVNAKNALAELKDTEAQLIALREKHFDLENNLDKLNVAYSERHRVAALVQSELQQALYDLKQIQPEMNAKEDELKFFRYEMAELEIKYTEALSRINSQMQELSSLQQKACDAAHSLAVRENRIIELHELYREVNMQRDALTKENACRIEELSQLTRLLEEKESENISKKHDATIQENVLHTEELAKISDLLAERELENAKFQQVNRQLTSKLEQDSKLYRNKFKLLCDDARLKLARRECRISELTEMAEVLTKESAKLREDKVDRINEISILTKRLQEEEERISQLVVERDELHVKISSVTAERDQAQKYCRELLASTSWRVSAPVRAVGKILHRYRR